MRNLLLFSLLIVLLIAAQFASAKTVDEIIEKYIRARGGRNKLASVKSIYMEGIKEMNGGAFVVKITKEQDKLSRTEIENNVVLITAEGAWTFFPTRSPEVEKIPTRNLAGIQTEMDIAGPLVDYIAKGHRAELLGKEQLEDNTCYKIKLTTGNGKEMMFWIDASTYLVNQSSAMPEDGGHAESFILYRNYREVDGVQFPHTYETKTNRTINAEPGKEIVFYTIQINPVINPTIYQPNSQS